MLSTQLPIRARDLEHNDAVGVEQAGQAGAMTPICPNALRALDFQFDAAIDGRQVKLLNLIDEFNREAERLDRIVQQPTPRRTKPKEGRRVPLLVDVPIRDRTPHVRPARAAIQYTGRPAASAPTGFPVRRAA